MRGIHNLPDRLRIKIAKDANGCWIWTAYKKRNGYGALTMNGKWWSAPRAIWTLLVDPIPNGMHILHTCDVRACVNPAHLYLGKDRQNVADKMARGRYKNGGPFPGEKNPMAKLTPENVQEIRMLYNSGKNTSDELASKYNVRRSTVTRIAAGTRWGHL